MRIMTVRQPWAEAIIWGGKDVENRKTNIAGNYRGLVAIHEGQRIATKHERSDFIKNFPDAYTRIVFRQPERKLLGAIIGVVDLVDVVHANSEPACVDEQGHYLRQFESRWAEHGMFHLHLANPRPLDTPIPYKGALGMRTLPPDVEDQIMTQIGATV